MKAKIARTGRVQSWLDEPSHRLPVSCTIVVPEDNMESIQDSWTFASYALRHGAGVAVHLSNLRPKGSDNGRGLIASGAVSFGKIYSTLNEVLRRGGVYRSGAITLHLDADHGDLIDFITAKRGELPWVKRCVNIDQESWDNLDSLTKGLLFHGIQAGDIWLAKKKYDKQGRRVRFNVCLEVALLNKGSCLLQHVNLAACEKQELIPVFEQAMKELCELHPKTGVDKDGFYRHPKDDRQVGLGMIGLANFLSYYNVSYKEFGEALAVLNAGKGATLEQTDTEAWDLALYFMRAINAAADVADKYHMDRAFAIAPTATCSYRYSDRNGYTATPEIAPPIATSVDRDSSTYGVTSADYGYVETAWEVGWEAYYSVATGICQLLENTGLFHGYSFNTWTDVCTYDEEFIQKWLDSPLTSMYYSLRVMPDTQRKDDAAALIDDEDYKDLFNFEENNVCSTCAE